MSPKKFLQGAGVIMIVGAVLGYVGILGPTAAKSIFGASWWVDSTEAIVWLVLGVIALGATFVVASSMQKTLALAYGVVLVLVAVWSFLGKAALLGMNLELADSIFLLVVGAAGLWAALAGEKAMGGGAK